MAVRSKERAGEALNSCISREASNDRPGEQARQAVLERFFRESSDAVVVSDESGRLLDVNESFLVLTGYSREEVLGRYAYELGLWVDSEPSAERSLDDEATCRYRTRVGEIRYAQFSLQAVEVGSERLILVIARDISEQRDAAAAIQSSLDSLRRADRQRKNLLLRLVTAQAEERRTISEEIHDDTIQVMTSAIMTLSLLCRSIIDPEEFRLLAQTEGRVKAAMARLRNLAFELRPPALEKTGLAAGLHDYLAATLAETSLTWSIEDRTSKEQPLETQLVLYRIAQEAVSNIVKHAAATRVEITLLHREGGFILRISDDGVGLSPSEDLPPGHLGLTCMKDRAALAGGRCRVDGTPGVGTTIECWVPGPQRSLFGSQPLEQDFVPIPDEPTVDSIWNAETKESDHVSAIS